MALVEVPANKGTLLSDVRVATVGTYKSNVKRVRVEGMVYHLWKYVYGVRKSMSWFRPCVSDFNLRIRACSSIKLSVKKDLSNSTDRLIDEQTLIRILMSSQSHLL